MYACTLGLGQSMIAISGFSAFIIIAVFALSSQLRFKPLNPLTALSISSGGISIIECFVDSFVMLLYSVLLCMSVSILLSVTPKISKSFICSSVAATPAIISGPIMHPLPASSIPSISFVFRFSPRFFSSVFVSAFSFMILWLFIATFLLLACILMIMGAITSLDDALKSISPALSKGTSFDDILEGVCAGCGVFRTALLSDSDSVALWIARGVAVYNLRELTGMSFMDIGKSLSLPVGTVANIYDECRSANSTIDNIIDKPISDKQISIRSTDPLLNKFLSLITPDDSVNSIISTACSVYGISENDLRNIDCRLRRISRARSVVMYALSEFKCMSYNHIGEAFRNKQDVPATITTVRICVHKVKNALPSLDDSDKDCGEPRKDTSLENQYESLGLAEIVRDVLSGDIIAPDLIVKFFSDRTGFPVEKITGKTRRNPLPAIRAALINVLYERGSSYAECGSILGDRHHSTIIYAVRSLESCGLYLEKSIK